MPGFFYRTVGHHCVLGIASSDHRQVQGAGGLDLCKLLLDPHWNAVMARDTSSAWSESYTESRGKQVVSSVQLQEGLTDEIDAWALKHQITRSDAIRRLLELGLKAKPSR